MATTSKKRKPGATKKRKTRKAAAGAPAAKSRIKVGGTTFTKNSCHSTKTEAAKKAESIRKTGHRATVQDRCVFKGPKMKANSPYMKALKAGKPMRRRRAA